MAEPDPEGDRLCGIWIRVISGVVAMLSFAAGAAGFIVSLCLGFRDPAVACSVAMGGLAAMGFGIQTCLLILIYDKVVPLEEDQDDG